jgi:CheY-like chemotaxis protein
MKQILIVEDDALVADVYSQKLRSEGLGVSVAPDGKAGLEMFHSRKVDLVLLDLMLPQINGVELLHQIRSEFTPRELPVLVFTNAYLGGVVQQAWEAGANQVIPKAGIKPSMVVQMVKNALKDPPPSAVPTTPSGSKTEFDPEVRQELLDSSSETLAALWRPLKQLAGQGHHRDNHLCFGELFRIIRPLTTRAAIAAAPPPLLPPAVQAAFHGLQVAPNTSLNVCEPRPSSGVLVLPIRIAPAERTRATHHESAAAGPTSSGRNRPAVVGRPATSSRSFAA